LEATIDGLVATGHARLTTSEICRRAGVSQGALFKHFPSKADLLSAAASHLFALLVSDYQKIFGGVTTTTEDRVAVGCRLLRELFRSPRTLAAFEIYVAARTEDGLAEQLAPIVKQHRERFVQVAAELYPDMGKNPFFGAHIRLMHDALQGTALMGPVIGEEALDALAEYLVVLGQRLSSADT
jgi:AcrR family transcriptional regulator